MASTAQPTSKYVSSYSDKSDEWLRQRLEYKEEQERISVAGSVPRRKEIRKLRVEIQERKKVAKAAAEAQSVATVSALNGVGAAAGQRVVPARSAGS